MIDNLKSLSMIKEMMLGLMLKKARPIQQIGTLISRQLEVIITTLLLLPFHLPQLLLKRESTLLATVDHTSPHTRRETTPGMMPSMTNPMR